MTNEEAITRLKGLYGNGYAKQEQALEMAIRALKNEQTDGDLISRTDLLNAIWQKEYGIDYDGANLLNIKHIDIIENMPTYSAKADGDLISRQAVNKLRKYNLVGGVHTVSLDDINKLPSAEKTAEEPIKHFGAIECPNCGRLLMLEEQTYGWCKGCKEYDTEKHCCHRYSSFIRESLQDSINAVLEDIKAEIAENICLTDNPYTEQTEYTISHEKVLEIIDKHISGKEE